MSSIAVNAITDANGGNTTSINGTTPNAYNTVGKNLIINGAMRIDQRNSGSAVTINTTSNTYTLDRWMASGVVSDGVFTVVQSTEAPAGFNQSTKITVTTADASIGSTESYVFGQFIEGNNVAHLNWGTSNAKTVTLSFWIRSSVTGTFSGVIHNSDVNKCYPFTYTISTADTWEKQTVTVDGDTSGTWLSDTGRGIVVRFSLGVGSSLLNTAGAWASSTALGATGETQLISTLNATLYITGVQLEVGESATEFEHRLLTLEQQLCYRYFYASEGYYGNSSYQHSAYNTYIGLSVAASRWLWADFHFPVPMRATPTVTPRDAAGNPGKQSIWNSGGGSLAHNYDPYSMYGNNEVVHMSDYVNAKYGICGHLRLDAEL